MVTKGWDCVIVPGALMSTKTTIHAGSKICGALWVTADGGTAVKSVCSEWEKLPGRSEKTVG